MKPDKFDMLLIGVGCCVVFVAVVAFVWLQIHVATLEAKQVRKWSATLAKEHHVSGQPWKVEVDEPTYEAARRTVKERLNWQDKCFMVEPVTSNYVDIRQMQITP